MFRFHTIAAALALTGCSAGFNKADLASNPTTTPGTGSPTSGTDTGTTQTENSPHFYALKGNLQVLAEEVDIALSTVEIDYRNEATDSLCSGDREVLAADPVANTDPDLPLFGWWDVQLDASPCGDFGQDQFLLGIGAWSPQLEAAAAAHNLTGEDLYSLYILPDGGDEVFVFGVSGTSEQFSGITPPATDAPLPDGVYQLRTLYLLPIDA